MQPEKIEPIPSGVMNFSMFVKQIIRENKLAPQDSHLLVEAFVKNLPFYFLALWQGFPEWDLTQEYLFQYQVTIQVHCIDKAGDKTLNLYIKDVRVFTLFIH